MQRGILIFAKNNEKIDYIKQAKVCSMLAKTFLKNIPVCLITDSDVNDPVFDIVKQIDCFKKQKRRYHSSSIPEELSYFNIGRTSAYELSPFIETILLDADYFIQNNTLDLVWGSIPPILMNTDYRSIYGPTYKGSEPYIGKWGPYMYWATAMYFRKDPQVKVLFDVAKHVEEYYDFYRSSYNLPGKMLRNDYVFSIAIELTGGNVFPLPVNKILNAYETDEILNVKKGSITFLCDRKHANCLYPVKVNNLNVHIMNKLDLNDKLDMFIEAYDV